MRKKPGRGGAQAEAPPPTPPIEPITDEAARAAATAHMVSVLNDPKASDVRKDRMSLALMQYGAGTMRKGVPPSKRSKTEEKAARAVDAGARFAARQAPKLVVNNS